MPHAKSKTISSRKAVIPVRALDFVMYNAKDVRSRKDGTAR